MGKTRWSRLVAGFAAAIVIVGGGAVAAHADQLTVDGIAPIDHAGQAASVIMCTGKTAAVPVLIAARRNGEGGKVFANGSTVTVSVQGATEGLSASLADTTIAVPVGWSSENNNFLSTETITAIVNVPAKTTPGAGSGIVTFGYTGVNIDSKGNQTTFGGQDAITVNWTVQNCDTTGPTLNLPGDLVAEAMSAAGAPVTYPVSATDADPADPLVTCTPTSGSTFPLGVTTVNCSAQDAARNKTEGSFTVTVRDTTAPLVSQPSDIRLETTLAGVSATWDTPTANDVVSGALPVTCTPASGSTFPVGVTEVTCSAKDAGDNIGSAEFTVTVSDIGAPALLLPAPIVEAAGPGGTNVAYTASASDIVDGTVTVRCAPASGALFPLGPTTVSCEASDSAGNVAAGTFTVKVVDTTAPVLTVPGDITEEATGPGGAAVAFAASAWDAVDQNPTVTCLPASGSTFPLETTTVECSATDASGNTSSDSFDVTVVDTTAPTITPPQQTVVREATGPGGTVVSGYGVSASDLVDESVVISCDPAEGSTFVIGMWAVKCIATDDAGNTSAEVTFAVRVEDTTPPALTVPLDITEEATGPAGAAVAFTASASDAVDQNPTVTCSAVSGSTFPVGTTAVTCSATDDAGNTASAGFDVTVVDTTKPTITWHDGPAEGMSYVFGSVPAAPTCTASDSVDTDVPCTVTGYSSAVGTHTLTATAKDDSGNTATAIGAEYTVTAWRLGGFFQPVDGGGIWNTVKGGSTVPLKFEVFAGAAELTATSAVSGFTVKGVVCPGSSAVSDDIELLSTGGTSLRYDTTAGQFIQNWQTPKNAGACYQVTMTTQDGSKLTALFKLK